jgi:hypothetical protein
MVLAGMGRALAIMDEVVGRAFARPVVRIGRSPPPIYTRAPRFLSPGG